MPLEPGPLPDNVIAALSAGNKIEAIKLLRAHAGLDLKGAKDAIDAVEDRYLPKKTLAPGEVPRSKRAWWIVAIVVVAIGAWYFLRRS